MKKTIKLPREFKKYFWDVDFKKLSFKKYSKFIISRIMGFGNMQAVRWMLKMISNKALKDFILKYGDRRLDRRSNHFWRICLDLPVSSKPINKFWPY